MTSSSSRSLAKTLLKPRILRRNLVAIAVLAVVITSIGLGKSSRRNHTRIDAAVATTRTELTEEPSDIQALLFEVRPFGFNPSELTVPAGRYLIVLSNRTGRSDLAFRLDREGNGRVSESRPNRRDWKQQVQLLPGNYTLTEANNPSWRCSIQVTGP
jgi:hypothetical protein